MYQLYNRIDRAFKRAPSNISLRDEYEMIGEVEASTRSEAVRKWLQGKDVNEESLPKPTVGDVVRDPAGNCFIFTPQGIWASVSEES